MLAERGDGQPRTLAGAFLKPIAGDDLMRASIDSLITFRDKMEKAYGASTLPPVLMDVQHGQGTLAEIVAYAATDAE